MPNFSADSSWLETIDQHIDIARMVSERNRENRRAVESWFLSSPIRNNDGPVNTSTESSCDNLTLDVQFEDIQSDESAAVSEAEMRSTSDFSKQEETLQETLLIQDILEFERVPIRRHSEHDQNPTAYFSNTTVAEQESSPISVRHSIYSAEDTKLPIIQMDTGLYNTAPFEHSSDDIMQTALNTIPMEDNTSSSSTLPRRNFKLSMDVLLHAFSKFTVCGQPSLHKTETYDTTFDVSDDDGHLSVNSLSTETGVNISYCS